MNFFNYLDSGGYAGLNAQLHSIGMSLVSHHWTSGEEHLIIEESGGKHVLYRR